MARLVDHQLRQLCRDMGLVEPFDPDMINPASIDVTLGPTVLVEAEPSAWPNFGDGAYVYQGNQLIVDGTRREGRWMEVDIAEKEHIMMPGQFVLAATAELIRVPNNLEADFVLKSSRGREGWNHMMAGYIDPGFVGRVTLELKNENGYHYLALKQGMRIGQLRFAKLDAIPMRSYASTGRYYGAEGVEASKG